MVPTAPMAHVQCLQHMCVQFNQNYATRVVEVNNNEIDFEPRQVVLAIKLLAAAVKHLGR